MKFEWISGISNPILHIFAKIKVQVASSMCKHCRVTDMANKIYFDPKSVVRKSVTAALTLCHVCGEAVLHNLNKEVAVYGYALYGD